jgi:hypothetical protein
LPSWIRIRIPNTDPDPNPQTQLNTDPIRIRIRIHNPGMMYYMTISLAVIFPIFDGAARMKTGLMSEYGAFPAPC